MRAKDLIVVGFGIAGLICALALAPRPVIFMTKTPRLEGDSSLWSKGGIAVACTSYRSPLDYEFATHKERLERTGWFSAGGSAFVGNDTRPLQVEK